MTEETPPLEAIDHRLQMCVTALKAAAEALERAEPYIDLMNAKETDRETWRAVRNSKINIALVLKEVNSPQKVEQSRFLNYSKIP